MIRKAQIKFIAIMMSILLAVFGVIFLVSTYVLSTVNDRSIERTLDDTKNSFFSINSEYVAENSLIVFIDIKPNSPVAFVSHYDKKVFNESLIEKIVETALARPSQSGSIGNIYYNIAPLGNQQLLVASDMSEHMVLYRTSILNAFFIFLGIYFLLFLIVWRLSFNVFQPIREAFYKQKQFVSNASHELKTPIAIISANADALKQDDDNHFINNIKSQTERLGVLVSDMLTLAKIDEGRVKSSLEEFNLSEEIVSNTLPFDAVAFEKQKTLILDVDDDITYKGDVDSVKKIVNILLDNAVKHADKNGEIKVSLKKENGKISLAVFNTGSNIPFHDSNKVFERFYRGDESRSRESGGSGLGLSIAKSIADANKWKISACSIPNESMTITVIF